MSNQLTINFNNFNQSLAKGWDCYLAVSIDEQVVTNITKTYTIFVPDGKHTLQCMFFYRSYSDSEPERYYTDKYTIDATLEDLIFTFNLYYITYERNNTGFDFGPGIIPQRENKGSSTGGCYVATCVYGSYNCPEVWTLRRYRDYTLSETWYGRTFIKVYYAISPTMVKWFGKYAYFKKLFRFPLNKIVKKLNNAGVENTPYNDKM